MNNSRRHLDTRLMQTGLADFHPDTGSAPVVMPSIRTSTVRFQNLEALDKARQQWVEGDRSATYGRFGLDTHAALEQLVCDLEGAQQGLLLPSGLAAITLAFLALLNAGDHVLVADCAYGPVRTLDRTVLQRLGIEVSYCPGTATAMEQAIQTNTRLIYIESPGSLLFEMLDIPALARLASSRNILLAADNTWGSGYLYQPLTLGADVSIVAGTKYIGGHSDLMLGAVAVKDPVLGRRMRDTHYAMGYSVSADDAWLALRGARTLPLRLRQHAQTALQVCDYLSSRPEVRQIYHPAWPDDPSHTLWQRDCTGSNGMLAFALDVDKQQARRFVNALELFSIGFSWGGFESLVQLVDEAALREHSYWSGATRQVIRLHAGLEHGTDLVADLAQAFDQI